MSEHYGNSTGGPLGNVGTNYNEAKDAVRMPEVMSQATELASDIEYTMKLVSELGSRLDHILVPSRPQAESAGRNPTEQSINTPLGNHLFEQRRRIQGVNAQLKDILQRCEL